MTHDWGNLSRFYGVCGLEEVAVVQPVLHIQANFFLPHVPCHVYIRAELTFAGSCIFVAGV